MTEPRESDYNGKPLLGLYRDAQDNFGFKFGVKKAKMIVEHLGAIKAFVEKHDRSDGVNAARHREVPGGADRVTAKVG